MERWLKLLYGITCSAWLTYLVLKLYAVPRPDANPNFMGAVYCFLLIGVLPSALGYLLLFKFMPWIRRALRTHQPAG